MGVDPTRDDVLELVGAVRRCLEDLIVFEGPIGIVPAVGGPESVVETPRAEEPAESMVPAPEERLEALRSQVNACTRCALAGTRGKVVFGAGDPRAGILFVGEAPGEAEDLQGEPFVGAAGQLLTRIIEAMQLRREQVYIANVLKCRPPGNRDPREEEVAACEPHLQRQIAIIRPRIICALGRIAAQALLKTADPLGRLRGRLHEYEGIPVVCTYHPAALLRNPEYKRPTWEDVKRVRRAYDGVEL